jgi:hypothetical protein
VASSRSPRTRSSPTLGHRPQQLHRIPLDYREPAGPGPRRRPGEPCGGGGDPGLGGGQATVGQQGEPVTVGDERDEGVEAGEQSAIL